jgi:hypothetical protein
MISPKLASVAGAGDNIRLKRWFIVAGNICSLQVWASPSWVTTHRECNLSPVKPRQFEMDKIINGHRTILLKNVTQTAGYTLWPQK